MSPIHAAHLLGGHSSVSAAQGDARAATAGLWALIPRLPCPCRADTLEPIASERTPAAVTPALIPAPQTHPRGDWGG